MILPGSDRLSYGILLGRKQRIDDDEVLYFLSAGFNELLLQEEGGSSCES
jgi:hypothetical protein